MLVARDSLCQEKQDSDCARWEAMEFLDVRIHGSGNNGALPLGEGLEGLARVHLGDEPRPSTGQETVPVWQPTFHPPGDRNGFGGRYPGEMYGDIEGEIEEPGGLEEEEAAAWLFGGDCEALGAEH